MDKLKFAALTQVLAYMNDILDMSKDVLNELKMCSDIYFSAYKISTNRNRYIVTRTNLDNYAENLKLCALTYIFANVGGRLCGSEHVPA